MTEAAIIGWAHSPFGKLEAEPDLESLIARVARAAIEDAGISPAEIDAGFVGIFGEGFTPQGFPASLLLQSVPEMRFRPITRYDNACATGSAAIHGARDFIAAGRGRFALVVGAEKMTATPGPKIGEILLTASYRKTESDIEGGVQGRAAHHHPLQRHGGGAGGAGGARAPQQRRCAGQAVRAALHRRPRAVQQRLRRADLAGRGHAVLPRRQAHPGREFNPPIHPDCVGVLEFDGFSGREKHPGGAPLL
jgi:hypothetical protein